MCPDLCVFYEDMLAKGSWRVDPVTLEVSGRCPREVLSGRPRLRSHPRSRRTGGPTPRPNLDTSSSRASGTRMDPPEPRGQDRKNRKASRNSSEALAPPSQVDTSTSTSTSTFIAAPSPPTKHRSSIPTPNHHLHREPSGPNTRSVGRDRGRESLRPRDDSPEPLPTGDLATCLHVWETAMNAGRVPPGLEKLREGGRYGSMRFRRDDKSPSLSTLNDHH